MQFNAIASTESQNKSLLIHTAFKPAFKNINAVMQLLDVAQ